MLALFPNLNMVGKVRPVRVACTEAKATRDPSANDAPRVTHSSALSKPVYLRERERRRLRPFTLAGGGG